MELRHLRQFLAVAQTEHFGRAADGLHIAGPALSRSVRQLEASLGTPLFERTTRQVELTEAGRVFAGEVRRILAELDGAVGRARLIGQGASGVLRVGVTGSASYGVLPRVVRRVKSALPDVELTIDTEMLTPLQAAALTDGRLDLALLRTPVAVEGIAHRVLFAEPLILALPQGHRFDGDPDVTVADLQDEAFVTYPADTGSVVDGAVVGRAPPRASRRAAHTRCRRPRPCSRSSRRGSVSPWSPAPPAPSSSPASTSWTCPTPRASSSPWRGARPTTRPCSPASSKRSAAPTSPTTRRPRHDRPAHHRHRRDPLSDPLRQAAEVRLRRVTHADHVLVRVHTAGGLVGVADAPPRPFTYGETQAGIVAVIDGIFAPQLVGLDADRRAVAHARMHRTVGNPAAKAAVDMAVWDVLAQAWGTTVNRALGGFTDRMRVCHMLGFDAPAAMAQEASAIRDRYGITTFKVKVGRRPIDLDVDVVRALRNTLGDKAELYIDGNRGWTPSESLRALDMLADAGLTLAEELCPADDVLGRRRLVANCRIPFVGDESVTTPAEVTRELLGAAPPPSPSRPPARDSPARRRSWTSPPASAWKS